MERLTQTSNLGGVAFTFDLDITCQPSEMKKILKLAEKLKCYEDAEEHGSYCKWIPVSERLPEESLNSVIGWDTYRNRCCFVQYLGGRFVLGDDIYSVNVTAWMPLPEPYLESEVEDGKV